MMNKNLLISLALMAVPAVAQEQKPMDHGTYAQLDNELLWHNTANAAGLGLDKTPNRGLAGLDYSYAGGDFYRAQEGTSTHNLQFSTESHQQINNYLYGYGRFAFNNGRTKDRAWADVMRPYNSNPYFSGSSVPGRYDHQDMELTAAIGTSSFGKWHFGVRLDYALGDLSRLRDPRSRAQLLDYKLTPSAVYQLGKHAIGLAGWYNRRKEKINGLTTVQQDATLKYYFMTGLENANGSTGGYSNFQREWVNHDFGVELSWGYAPMGGMKTLNSVTLQRGSESVLGQYKYSPGHYYNYVYAFKSQTLIPNNGFTQRIDFKARYEEGYADEYRQQLVITNDPQTGLNSYHYETQLSFKKRYQVTVLDLGLHYRISEHTVPLEWLYMGAMIDYKAISNKYLLHTSEFQYESVNPALEIGGKLGRISVNMTSGYSFSTRSKLALANSQTDYAKQVLLPDMKYYELNYFFGHFDIVCDLPVNIKKTATTLYAKAWCDSLETKKYGSDKLRKYQVGVSLGVVY
ncbi:DUF6850 family outer membrane beta-barrel protein [Segatella maculosa]|uniref:DUF6850 family outer membrane beta-barrel protein n=1 Tax=Segatella maculosa TaxID=439703 RepID=UPI00248FAF35|nr:DUF6850 family outer membrane beta-barrel protein [Segatella maculosa]